MSPPRGEGARDARPPAPDRSPEPLAIEYRPVACLIPYARNARTHSEAQVALIAGSIREYGFTNPVLVDGDNGIIAGHGRVLAARKLGLASVPVIELGHLSEAQKRAYVLADNKLAEQAGWDSELLALELGELAELGIDLGALGFEAAELDALLDNALPDPREEETPEPPAVPVSRPGDLWLLGPHRLLCGSSTEAADVARLLGGVRPHLMVTDPPYGVSYDPAWRNRAGLSATKRTGKVLNDDRADWREAWALFPGEVAYVWHGALHATTVAESLEACGFAIRSQIIWAKERLVLSRGDYHWQHEPCWYAVRDKGEGPLERRPQADHALADPEPRPGRHDRARHPEAGRVHAPADAEQQLARPGGLRAVLRIGDARSSPPRPAAASRSRWSSTRPTSMWRCPAGRPSPAKTATLDGDGRSFAEIAAERRRR